MRRSQDLCLLLTVICLLLPVLKAQIYVKSEIWGYIGQEELVLPCQLYDGTVTQAQWDLMKDNANEGDRPILLAVHSVSIPDTKINSEYLDKLDLREFSLVIKNLAPEDAGVYTCQLATFPHGNLVGKTTVRITDQMPLSAGVVSAIVISVLLLLGIIAATAYFIVIRRRPPSSRNQVTIDTDGWDPTRPSFIKREDQVIYSDVTAVRQPPKQNRANSSEDQVTYSEVRANRTTSDDSSDVMDI